MEAVKIVDQFADGSLAKLPGSLLVGEIGYVSILILAKQGRKYVISRDTMVYAAGYPDLRKCKAHATLERVKGGQRKRFRLTCPPGQAIEGQTSLIVELG